MITLAYDGSINGDWVAHYAIRMAARDSENKLLLVHILDGAEPSDRVSQGINAIEHECGRLGVLFESAILPLKRSVFETLRTALATRPRTVCVCGTRARSRRRGYFSGTVSENLFRSGPCPLMALRVVRPGLLGTPRRLLFPLSGNPRRMRDALPFLRLLPARLEEVFIIHVLRKDRLRLKHGAHTNKKIHGGREYIQNVLLELRAEFESPPFQLDGRVFLSDDWPGEILIQASKFKTDLMLLGSSGRRFASRFLHDRKLERLLGRTPCDVAIYQGV